MGSKMTLEEAVEILTQNQHRKCDWTLAKNDDPFRANRTVYGRDRYDVLDEFEAIAIAEAYKKSDRTVALMSRGFCIGIVSVSIFFKALGLV